MSCLRGQVCSSEGGLDSERGPLQADNSAQSAPEATLPDPRTEDIGNDLDSLFEGIPTYTSPGESDGDDDDGVDDKPD
jgi:hypothetical protein